MPMSDDTEGQWDEAAAMVDAASAAADANRLDEAVDLARTASATLAKVLGADHPDAANGRLTLGRILQRQQKHKEALPHFEHAVISLLQCEDPDESIHE